MPKLTSAEQLLYSTVRVEAVGPTGTFHGTAFYWRVKTPKGDVMVLVTNKHVIEGCIELKLHCHLVNSTGDGPSGQHFKVSMTLGEGGIVRHPDPKVDLCAISAPIDHYAAARGQKVFAIYLNGDLIPTASEWDNFDAYEEVIMVGCPNGLFDQHNNVPILRRGITASHPSMRYGGEDEFMIDVACFPGSSGSPVLLFDMLGYLDKKSGDYLLGVKRVKLLGVLYAGPTVNQQGQIALTKTIPFSVSSMMHLGYVLRSSRLTELETEILKAVRNQDVN